MTVTWEERQPLQRLTVYRHRIQEIINLIGERNQLFGPERTQAQELLKTLKAELKDEYMRCDTQRTRKQMSEAELQWYCRAIQETYVEIERVRVNSTPRQQRTSRLYFGLTGLDYYIDGLERHR